MKEKILEARTHRRYSNKNVDLKVIREVLNVAKNSSSAMNMQLSRYIIVNEDEMLKEKIFSLTNLPTFHKVEDEYKPAGYIIVVAEKERIKRRDYLSFDQGIAYQNINLMMNNYGLKTVCLFSPNKVKLEAYLDIDIEKYEISYALAYGYPIAKDRKITETTDLSLWRYYKDEDGIYNVPKLTLDIVLIDEK